MKKIVQVWLAFTLLAVSDVRAQAPLSPAELEVNLGPLHVDKYDGTTLNSGAIDDDKNCTSTSVYRECVRHILSNYDGQGAGGDYNSQGIVGVAIQIGMAGGAVGRSDDSGSTPFSGISGGLNQKWLDNLYLFFQDLRAANVHNVTLRVNTSGGFYGSETMAYTQYCTFETVDPILGQLHGSGTGPVGPCSDAPQHTVAVPLVCYPWLPWCNINVTDSTGTTEQCYNGCADPNGYNNAPYLPQSLGAWPWTNSPESPFVTWFRSVLQRALWAQVNIREVDLLGEVQLSQWPVEARMIYDNVNTVPGDSVLPGAILSYLSAVMASYGFDSGAVVVSSLSWNPPYSQTCNSGVYVGDSGLMLDVAELWGAEVGAAFGVLDNYDNPIDGLQCGSGFQGAQYLPFTFTPNVIDIHAYPADEVNDPGAGWISNPNDNTFPSYYYPADINPIDPNGASGSSHDAAMMEYSAMATFAQSRRIYYNAPPTIIIGETDTNSPDQVEGQLAPLPEWGPPDGYWHRPNTPKAANENARGFYDSSLRTQSAASVVIRPFDPMGFNGEVRTPAALGPPTSGPYEASGPCTYTVWQYPAGSGSWTFSAIQQQDSIGISAGANCQWSAAPPPPGQSSQPDNSIPSWFTITSPTWQTGSDSVAATLSANTSSSPRSFQLVVAGQTITVIQAAGNPPPAAPTNLNPPNFQGGVSLNPVLSWSAASGATGYNVFLGTYNPPPLVASLSGVNNTTYDVTGLLYASTAYYWYVVATNSAGSTSSGTISFNTIASSAIQTPGTKVGIFRNNAAFLEDSNGDGAYEGYVDRYLGSFAGPNGFMTGDLPVSGDWTGDGHAKIGIYRSSTGQWFLDANNNGVYDAGDYTYGFGGLAGDIPVVGDWNQLGKSCIGIFRNGQLQGQWLLDLNCNGSFDNQPNDNFFPFGGLQGDVPVVGKWTGGNTRVGVVRCYNPTRGLPCQAYFWVYDMLDANNECQGTCHQPAQGSFAFGGLNGDLFVTGDWYNQGISRAGVYRPSNGLWLLDVNGNQQNVLTLSYGGISGDLPVTGKW